MGGELLVRRGEGRAESGAYKTHIFVGTGVVDGVEGIRWEGSVGSCWSLEGRVEMRIHRKARSRYKKANRV